MKKILIILFLIQILLPVYGTFGQELRMLLLPKVGATDPKLLYLSRGLNDIFFTDIIPEAQKYFPCVGITDPKSTEFCMAELRLQGTPEFGGRDVAPIIQKITSSIMNPDFAVKYSMYVESEQMISASVVCANSKGEIIADFTMPIEVSAMMVEGTIPPVKKLIDELKKYEICPFTGPVSITISSDLDSTNVEEYGVYCNQSDQRYHKELEIKNHTFSDWKLERKGIPWTEGTMTFYTNEETKVTEENGCYKCKTGQEGRHTYSVTSSMKVKGSGISHESIRNGKPQDDARVELKFLEDGTYYVTAKGTSQPVTGEEKVVTGAEGTCDNMPQETKVVPREIKIPLNEIFGPYQGKTTDKVLAQKVSKEKYDPTIKEKTTITIDFTLTKKGK